MPLGRKLGMLAFVAGLAIAGYYVATWVPQIAVEYEKAAEFNRYWGYFYLAAVASIAGLFLGLTAWLAWTIAANTVRKRRRQRNQLLSSSQMTPAQREAEIQAHLADTQNLADDVSLPAESRVPIRAGLADLQDKMTGQKLEIVAFGTVSSGKSSLLNALAGRDVFRTDPKGGTTVARNEVPWTGQDKVVLVDAPGLAEVHGEERESLARQIARDADLVLFVVDGPLKDFEFKLLAQLHDMEKRVLVCLNKSDWFRETDRSILAGQLIEQTRRLVAPEDVLTLRAQPGRRVRVRVLADGSEVEEAVDVDPDISPLAERMLDIVQQDGRDLLAANLLLRARGLATDARRQVQTALDKRAQQVVDRYMWQAGGAAALSPLPVLDVAVGLAISTKMVFELARVYRQSIDIEAAGRLIGELGKNLVSILGASVASPALGTAVASLLKTIPGVGTIAGGVLQGLVQAIVTRWIGQVFIVYFRDEMREPPTGWAALARAKWDQVTRPAELAQLAKAGLARWGAKRNE